MDKTDKTVKPGGAAEKRGSAASRAAKKKAIVREYEMKRRELGLGNKAPRRGIGFFLLLIVAMGLISSIVFKQAGIVEKRKRVDTKKLYARRSVDALAEALGRYKFHCGCYPSAEDGGLEALSAKTSRHKGWLGPYASSRGHIIPDPWKNPYVYEPKTNGHPVVMSMGPDGVRGTADDIVADPELFEKPFNDVSWTNNWVHFSKRGLIVVPRKSAQNKDGGSGK